MRRFTVTAAVVALAALLISHVEVATAAPSSSCTTAGINQAQQQIFADTNAARAQNGQPPLAGNFAMNAVAAAWSQNQASRSKMEHNPSYSSQVPSGWRTAGENVAYGYTAATVTTAWMNSPGHRANIVSAGYTHIGVGVACSASGAMYFTQVFGGYPLAPSQFFDVDRGMTFYSQINWLADRGVSTGWSDGTYRPYQPVIRESMAAFLYRLAGSPAYTPPARSPFTDVPTSHFFYKEISWLASAGISTGWGTPSGHEFRPSDPIARGEMAAFMYRFLGGTPDDSSADSPFIDVSAAHVFATEIRWVAAQGISTGWDAGEGCRAFRPFDSVSRDVMAAFLHRMKTGGAAPVSAASCSRT